MFTNTAIPIFAIANIKMKRVVIKVGTNVLTDENGSIDKVIIRQLVDQIAHLKQLGKEVVLVSSGAVGAGRDIIHLSEKANPIVKRQVYSSIGQIKLIGLYQEALLNKKLHCAQVLTTKEDFRDRKHFVNMKQCLLALLRADIIPVVNENDVISINELMFTDNDELSGLVAALINADSLFLLTSVDGVMHPETREVIPQIDINENEEHYIMSEKSSFGRGGMGTKVRIAKHSAHLGIDTYIANGRIPYIIDKILEEKAPATYFAAQRKKSGYKKWIAYNSETKGYIVINKGAEVVLRDLEKVASILPVGIVKTGGVFKKGEIVEIYSEEKTKIGIGQAAYSEKKLSKIIGQKGKKAFIHYDHLLIY